MNRQSRRQFLENAALAATGTALFGATIHGPAQAEVQSKSPNERLRVALLGVNGQGQVHLGSFAGRDDCEIVAICDVDEAVGQTKGVAEVERMTGRRPAYYQDLRRMFDDKSIDIVSIATPNHWHALAAIWAIQAGKDVYVEKPVSHNVSEGRRIVDAARKYGRICQTGTQCRSAPGMRELMRFLHSGGIGEIKLARGLCYKRRPSIGPRGTYTVPSSVDFDLWCGPASKKPLTREKFHYDWHWQWDYGNGDLGNQGIHQMDLARWGLGVNDLGRSVVSYGARVGYKDAGETANTQVSVHDYGDKTLIFEVRGLPTEPFKGARVGVVFYGSQGYAVSTSYAGGAVYDLEGNVVREFDGEVDPLHFANFVNAVRSRQIADLYADVEQGHLSSALCHLANISYRLGEALPMGELQSRLEALRTTEECLETFDRVRQHLAANQISADSTKLHLGPLLAVEPGSERFTGAQSDKANPLLTREYRAGFEVPATAAAV
ncbi:MAG: Gfo/Idh/MocA family protein [Planctomycetaceae bacterium]